MWVVAEHVVTADWIRQVYGASLLQTLCVCWQLDVPLKGTGAKVSLTGP
jgi:hypothetical protein